MAGNFNILGPGPADSPAARRATAFPHPPVGVTTSPMFESLKTRFILIFALAALSVWTLVDRGVLLGLDLRGGTHLAVEVDDPTDALSTQARADAIDRAL